MHSRDIKLFNDNLYGAVFLSLMIHTFLISLLFIRYNHIILPSKADYGVSVKIVLQHSNTHMGKKHMVKISKRVVIHHHQKRKKQIQHNITDKIKKLLNNLSNPSLLKKKVRGYGKRLGGKKLGSTNNDNLKVSYADNVIKKN